MGIPNPQRRADQYPHEFSGGMRQRAMIAMALMNNPELLIADEPTTALDVTVQAQILDLMRDLQAEFGSAIIMITHDLGVVAEIADDVLVMYGGKCVEYAEVDDAFHTPDHPYTWGLLTSMPRLDRLKQDRLVPVAGNPPSLINIPPGCAFHPRCTFQEFATHACDQVVPELAESYRQPRIPVPHPGSDAGPAVRRADHPEAVGGTREPARRHRPEEVLPHLSAEAHPDRGRHR